MSNLRPSQRLRDYTSVPIEILIASFSVLPVLLLIYFYNALPERIAVFLNLRGEVAVWAAKSFASVFRVPLMAIDLQLICLLTKYGTVQSQPRLRAGESEAYLRNQRRATALSARLWDWLRLFTAVKMCAESLDPLFRGDARLHFLRTPGWVVTWVAVVTAVAGALFYGYRLMAVRREMKGMIAEADVERHVDKKHLRGGVFYYNPGDEALFVEKYLLNFANKWAYLLLACLAAYPLLVFLSM